jgi:hypothetical protein
MEGYIMASRTGTPNVGASDPKLKTSPVWEETDEESYYLGQQVAEDSVCYFNNRVYVSGEFVRSGPVILECRRGLWVEVGPSDPENP